MDDNGEVSQLDCSADGVRVFIKWDFRILFVQVGNSILKFRFERCRIRSAWEEPRSFNYRIQCASLECEGAFNSFSVTLQSFCPVHDGAVLARLAAELNFALPRAAMSPRTPADADAMHAGSSGRQWASHYDSSAPIQRLALGPLSSIFAAEFYSKTGGAFHRPITREAVYPPWTAHGVVQACLMSATAATPLSPTADSQNLKPHAFSQEHETPAHTGSRTLNVSPYISHHLQCTCPDEVKHKWRRGAPQRATFSNSPTVSSADMAGARAMESFATGPLTSLAQKLLRSLFPRSKAVNLPKLVSGSTIYGSFIEWSREPLWPIQLFLIRHGQQTDIPNPSSLEAPLSNLGIEQMLRSCELLWTSTGGFVISETLCIAASQLLRTKQSAELMRLCVRDLTGVNTDNMPSRRSVEQLNEFLPQTCSDGVEEFDKRMADASFWSLSSLLHTLKGPLLRGVERRTMEGGLTAADICSGTSIQLTKYPRQVVERYRWPVLSRSTGAATQLLFSGCFLGRNPSTLPPVESGHAQNVLVCGHSNSLRTFILRELNFPPDLLWQLEVPHGAVIAMGCSTDGLPALILADAAYVLIGDSRGAAGPFVAKSRRLPKEQLESGAETAGEAPRDATMTFTAFNSCALDKTQLTTNLLTNDQQLVTLARGDAVKDDLRKKRSRFGCAPDESNERLVLLIRSGHNMRAADGADAGLTEVGVAQLKIAGRWISEFLKSGVVYSPPADWAICGLSSARSTVQISLKQSIELLRKEFEATLGAPDDTDDEALFPEMVFGIPTTSGELLVLVGDEYHLLKYFAVGFGLNPSGKVRRCLWPHAGHLIVTVTEKDLQLRTFGMISHMAPNQISILPGGLAGSGAATTTVSPEHNPPNSLSAKSSLPEADEKNTSPPATQAATVAVAAAPVSESQEEVSGQFREEMGRLESDISRCSEDTPSLASTSQRTAAAPPAFNGNATAVPSSASVRGKHTTAEAATASETKAAETPQSQQQELIANRPNNVPPTKSETGDTNPHTPVGSGSSIFYPSGSQVSCDDKTARMYGKNGSNPGEFSPVQESGPWTTENEDTAALVSGSESCEEEGDTQASHCGMSTARTGGVECSLESTELLLRDGGRELRAEVDSLDDRLAAVFVKQDRLPDDNDWF